jgi:hypothetical protein
MAAVDERRNAFVPLWATVVLAAVALFLVPWTLWLTYTLPSRHVANHWRIAWVGFDAVLALLLVATAIAAVRREPWIENTALVGGTLLLADAWFDVLTSTPGDELRLAAGQAAFAEVPLALLCFWIAFRTERFFRETDRLRS